jgi:hypothetical protein
MKHHLLREHAVRSPTEGPRVVRALELSIQPVWKETGRDSLAASETAHRAADRDHFTGPVGGRDDRPLSAMSAPRQDDVTVVQRSGVNTHTDVMRLEFRGCALDTSERIKALPRLHFVSKHVLILREVQNWDAALKK